MHFKYKYRNRLNIRVEKSIRYANTSQKKKKDGVSILKTEQTTEQNKLSEIKLAIT